MPNVLRHRTYAQTLEYLRRHLRALGVTDPDPTPGGGCSPLRPYMS
jgi:hypothetical protein